MKGVVGTSAASFSSHLGLKKGWGWVQMPGSYSRLSAGACSLVLGSRIPCLALKGEDGAEDRKRGTPNFWPLPQKLRVKGTQDPELPRSPAPQRARHSLPTPPWHTAMLL